MMVHVLNGGTIGRNMRSYLEYSCTTLLLILILLARFEIYLSTPLRKITNTKSPPTKPTEAPLQMDVSEAADYLSRYGYLNHLANVSTNNIPKAVLTSAIKDFQAFFSIKQTGRLDNVTITKMRQPRCALPDKKVGKNSPLKALFKLWDADKWPTTNLKYQVEKYWEGYYGYSLTKHQIDEDIRKAFEYWSRESSLTFTKGMGEIKFNYISINFEVNDDNFERPSQILGYARGPTSGKIRLDALRKWTVNTNWGVNVFHVVAHEVGHALGLDHSQNPDSIMIATYSTPRQYLRTAPDDVEGIRKLYGRGKGNKDIDYKSPVHKPYGGFNICHTFLGNFC